MATTPSPFGVLLRRMRIAAALSQEELAERAGISARGISDLERGARQKPRPETLRLIADVLAPEDPARAALLAAASDARPEPRGIDRLRPPMAFPAFDGTLVGREDELATVTALLVDTAHAFVTITGPGGVGKTRFAVEAACQVSDTFRDGLVFVDLAPITDARLVISTIARAVGADEMASDCSLATLAMRMRHHHALLILDNCEQVLGAAVELGQLHDACPALTILATGRAAFGLRGEQEWPLNALAIADLGERVSLADLRHVPAVALFATCAAAAAPGFALSAANVDAVVSVCQQVDGLPLAIELAAARCRHLAVTELASRLHHRLPLLTGGPCNAPARQQTLRATIAWSYDLLCAAEQSVLRQVSVFVGGWTLEAAEAVVQVPVDETVLGVLSSLRDQHLITSDTRGSQTRYSMLETIREFARDLLTASPSYAATLDQHAAYCLELAQRGARALETADQRPWVERLDTEQPNLRQALDHLETSGDGARYVHLVTTMCMYWDMRSNAAEGLPRIMSALRLETGDTLMRAQILLGAAAMGYVTGAYADALQWLCEAEQIARRIGSSNTLFQVIMQQGGIAEHLGDEETTAARYHEAMELALATRNTWALSYVYPNLSDAAYRRGEVELADYYAHQAIAPIRETDNRFLHCMNLGCLGQVWLARSDVVAAADAFTASLALAVDLRLSWNIANAIAGAAAVAAATDRPEDAALLLGAAEAACAATGHAKLPQFYLFAQTTARVTGALGLHGFRTLQAQGRAWEELLARERANAILTATRDDTMRQVLWDS